MIVDVLNLTGRLRRAMRGSGSASFWAKAGVIRETPGRGQDEIARIRIPTEGLFGRPLQAPEENRHSHQTQLVLGHVLIKSR
jgi:hypothetical protein